MTDERKKRIEKISSEILELKMKLKRIYKEEKEFYDTIPEELLDERFSENSRYAMGNLEFAIDWLDSARRELKEVK